MAPLVQYAYWSLASFHLKLRQLRGGARSIYSVGENTFKMYLEYKYKYLIRKVIKIQVENTWQEKSILNTKYKYFK